MATRPRVPSIEQSIAEKYGIQETSRWTGQPIPQDALLTPEEQEYLKTMPKPPPSVPSVPSIPAVTGVGEPTTQEKQWVGPPTPVFPEPMPMKERLSITGEEEEISSKEEISPKTGITIPMTQAELNAVAQHNAEATCAGDMQRVNTYKVSGWDDAHNWTQLYVEAVDKKSARAKAVDAGYNVKSVTRQTGGITTKEQPVQEVAETRTGGIPQDEINRIRPSISDSKFLSDALDNAVAANDADIYNNAVDEYNQAIRDAHWYDLYISYKAIADKEWGRDDWAWFQNTYGDKINDTKYMNYLEGDEFQNKYATIIQPSSMSDNDYNAIRPYITPQGFNSEAALEAGKDSPAKAAQIIWSTNQFMLSTLSDDTRRKINSREWTLLPYGQVIETGKLDQMPPTYRQIVETSGLVGFQDYQNQVHEWNKQQGWAWNTIDAIGANAVRLGQDIKNFALLQLSHVYPKVKEGDPKPPIGIGSPRAATVGFTGFTPPTIATYTAEEAAEANRLRTEAQKYWKNLYDEAEMAAQEWNASRPYLQPVYPEGFVDSVKGNPSSLKDPLLWTETIANTLPYTVATGLIVGGFVGAGPAGVVATAPLAFGITLSVEGHDIYKDAIANGASHEQALRLANIYGSISASIETLGDSVFVGALGVAGGAFSQALGKNVGRNIITGAAKKYGWKSLTAGMIKDFVNQGGQEFFQEVVHNAAIKTVNENQALLENTANAFVSGVIGTAPFVFVPAGGQAINIAKGRLADVRVEKSKAGVLTPIDVTPQMQERILNKIFQPVSGFTVSTHMVAAEQLKGTPAQIEHLKQQYLEGKGKKTYEAGKNITVGLIDKKTVVTGATKVDETALAYTVMCNKVNEYAYTQLKLKQAQQAIADFGMAKSKAQLKILNEYKERAKELEAKLKDLKQPMIDSVQNFSDTFLKNSVGLAAEQKAEVKEMPKTIAMDIDNVTTQLFGERNAKEIAKDIKELEGQIKVIEEEMAKGMTRGQLEGYARLVSVLKGQVGDLVNELRLRYLAEGEKIKPDTKKLTMEVMSLQARLVKAVENLNNFTGSALNYDIYRKGELATKGEVVKMERDTFEAVQRTTEAIWGKVSYAEELSKLNSTLSQIIDSMQSLQAKKRATEAAFKIYDAIKKQDVKLLNEGIKMLQLEAGKIQDKPLQLAAQQQVKLLETLTAERFWQRFKESKPKKTEGATIYKSADFEAEQDGMIRREAERVVEKRLDELLHPIPDYIQRNWRSGEDMMEYLRKEYDKQYFQDAHLEEFEDVDDYLDVDKEEMRIKQEDMRQERLQRKQQELEIAERERDLAKSIRDKTEQPKRKATLDNYVEERERDVKQKKKELKTATKTKVVIPAEKPIDVTKSQEERGVAMTTKEEEEKAKEKARSREKAAKQIRIAKKAIAEEEELAKKKEEEKKEEKVSAFPGIKPKTAPEPAWAYPDVEHALAQYHTLAGTKTKISPKTAVEHAIEEGLQTRTAVQTQIATRTKTKAQTATQTQTQVKTAVQIAVETALQEKLETATKEELKPVTKLITEIVTKTTPPPKTIIPPKRFRMEPVKGKQKKIREGPALAVWKQGMYWVSIFPSFRTKGTKPDVVYSRHKPPWGAVIAKGRHSPRRTLKSIGKVPPLIELPMGVVTARVKHGKKLTFSRRKYKSSTY